MKKRQQLKAYVTPASQERAGEWRILTPDHHEASPGSIENTQNGGWQETNERDFWIETQQSVCWCQVEICTPAEFLHAPRERAHASVASEATQRHQRHCWIRHHSFHRQLPNTEQIVTIFSHQWFIKLRSSQLMATIWIMTFQRPTCFQLHQDDFDVSKMRHQRESGL